MARAPLKPDVRLAVVLAAATSMLMIAQQVASKALRDALFLEHFPVSSLPVMMIAAALLSLGMVVGISRLMARFSPTRLVPAMFAISAAMYLVEWIASAYEPRVVAVVVYVHTVTFGASAVSGFWSVISERFDPYVAKRVIRTIAAGATLGGLLGGVAVWQAAPHVELETLLVVLVAINAACSVLLARAGARKASAGRISQSPEDRPSALVAIRENPFLRHIGLYVLLLALGTSLFDYVFKARAKAQYAADDELLTFFALFYTVVGVATFAIQSGLVRRSLVRLGLAPTLAVLPASIILFGLGGVVFPGFASAVALRGAASTAENSFHRSAYELLYTPLASATKRATKLIIDVGADRLGTTLGGGLALGLITLTDGGGETVMLIVCSVIAAVLIYVLVRLNRGYVVALADSMRAGTVNFESEAGNIALDSETARATLAATVADLDLAQLLSNPDDSLDAARRIDPRRTGSIERLREAIESHSRLRASDDLPRPALADLSTTSVPDTSVDLISAAVRTLRSSDTEKVRALLTQPAAFELPLIAHWLPYLVDDAIGGDVAKVLQSRGAPVVGQLVDALLSPNRSGRLRCRVAQVLGKVPMQRSVHGLWTGLSDSDFEVAHECAIALLSLCSVAPAMAPSRDRVFAAVVEELKRSGAARRSHSPSEAFKRSKFMEHASGNVSMQLVHVFTLLALTLEAEPLELAFHSLQDEDDARRGTALEYLENVLPGPIRKVLWQHIDTGSALASRPGADLELAAELGRELAKRQISLSDLRARYSRRAR